MIKNPNSVGSDRTFLVLNEKINMLKSDIPALERRLKEAPQKLEWLNRDLENELKSLDEVKQRIEEKESQNAT